MNHTYSEQIATTAVPPVFTNATPPTVATNAIAAIRDEIIETILLTSIIDRTVIAPIINKILLSAYFGNPVQTYVIQSPSTLNITLISAVVNNETSVVFEVNTAPVFVD